jgi:PASTA domain
VVLALGLTTCSQVGGPTSASPRRTARPVSRMEVHASPPVSEEGSEPGEEVASPPAAEIPQGARVPDLHGMEFEDAVISLRKLGMDFGTVVARPSTEELWVVLDQTPSAGGRPLEDGRVAMTVSMGPPEGVGAPGGVASQKKTTSTSPTASASSRATDLRRRKHPRETLHVLQRRSLGWVSERRLELLGGD